jgi:serine/threonine protein kinase
MSEDASPSDGSFSQRRRVDEACDRFEAAWKAGQLPRIEDYLADVPEADRALLFRELLELEIELRREGGERPTAEEYHGRFAEYVELIHAVFANPPRDAESGPPGSSELATIPHTPPTHSSVVGSDAPLPSGSSPLPEQIGRYKVVRPLGGGTYGDVYLAHDAEMDRQVAIKVPSARLLATKRAREEFLREARNVARLQHEAIVRAYDFGQEADGRCYIVYEFVEGESLAERIKPERISGDPLLPEEAARIVAKVAEALHYAHSQEVFHRDIKPANILLNRQGKPKLTDFGLAVHEQDLASQRSILAGTLPYMSPEQVLSKGHHIDGRTDIYSLGVVFYELLCGRRPFEAKTKDKQEDQILHREAKPPRQIKDSIPPELERICLRALSKRINDRYTTAIDMAEELHQLVEGNCYAKQFDSQVDAARKGAAQALWERYCDRLVRLARRKLRHTSRRVADEDDIAQSAFSSLCLGARRGRFPELGDRESLWGLLVFITAQKAADWIVHRRRKKRGEGKVRGHSALPPKNGGDRDGSFDGIVGHTPGPETLNVWAEQYGKLLDRLGDETLRKIAELRVQGYKTDEIAKQLGRARESINRKLRRIRDILLAGKAS